jgi:UDP-N-acetylglucosamine 2-epimerase (non-hydrolysing)
VLGIPCITLRPNTERPITVDEGTNQLVGTDRAALATAFARIDAVRDAAKIPALWDGQSARRIVEAVGRWMT